jgi:hypothetical protein
MTIELKNETLHIRISGVDAPECAHFGNPAQPHSAESLEWLKSTLMGKRMRVQLLRKDQYNRIVGCFSLSTLSWNSTDWDGGYAGMRRMAEFWLLCFDHIGIRISLTYSIGRCPIHIPLHTSGSTITYRNVERGYGSGLHKRWRGVRSMGIRRDASR